MAIRDIKLYKKDEVLRKKSKPVDKFDSRLSTLISDMIETMYKENGVGLAAPQVGVLKRVVVIDTGEGIHVLVNPEIVSQEGEQTDYEGCLSIPGYRGRVTRPAQVVVKAQDKEGRNIEVKGEGLLARALCHEIDHLDGILYIDKVIPGTLEELD